MKINAISSELHDKDGHCVIVTSDVPVITDAVTFFHVVAALLESHS